VNDSSNESKEEEKIDFSDVKFPIP